PYAADYNGALPSLASGLAGSGPRAGEFMLDYSIDPKSIPQINATKVLAGRFDPREIAGKTVIIGTNSELIGDQYYIPGVGKMGGVFVQIIGAETLKAGKAIDLGWGIALLLVFGLTAFAIRSAPAYRNALCDGGIAALLVGPI